jgi:hypothetical protein
MDLSPFYNLFKTTFNEDIEDGTVENSDILLESCFGNSTLLYRKKWSYSFLFLGESDRRLPIFIENGSQNPKLKDYSCILKGKSKKDQKSKNVVNFPLFVLYLYSFDFVSKFESLNERTHANIPPKNVCVIISNENDQEGRNYFIDKLNEKVAIDFAGNYKNNVKRIEDQHCSPGFIDFVSNYKVIITMENSKNDNYITEKILEGFAANIIPVYWGADNIGDYFNTERFINVKSFDINYVNDAIEKILTVLNSDEVFIEMVNKPTYAKTLVPPLPSSIPLSIDDISNDIRRALSLPLKECNSSLYNINQMFIILVSYRARGIQEFRRRQLIETIQNFKTYFGQNNIEYKIVIGEQNDDHKFNRGFLLNAAFLEAEKEFTFPKKYFHMNTDYTFDISRPFPKEILDFETGFIDLYRHPFPILGSACVFDAESYKIINGFPNDLEGWGGDDWAIYNRIQQNKINIDTPPGLFNSKFIIDEIVHFENDQSNNFKNIELARRNDAENNGLTTIKYNIDGYGEFNDGTKVFHYLISTSTG